MKIIAINGSTHPNGNTSILLNEVLNIPRKSDIETEVIHLNNSIQGCTGCGKCFLDEKHCCIQDDGINEIFQELSKADGILLGSPVYFADVSAKMKAFIERIGMLSMANNSILKHKIGAAVVAVRRGGGLQAIDTLHHFFHINEMFIVGASYWNMVYGKEIGTVLIVSAQQHSALYNETGSVIITDPEHYILHSFCTSSDHGIRSSSALG